MSNGHTQTGHSVTPKTNGSASPAVQNGTAAPSRPQNANKRGKRLAEIHAQRLPVTIKALPTFLPHNPLSIFQILWAIVSEYVRPYDSHPAHKYPCTFSPSTRSVHVTDAVTVRALWEQGFFGKGNLSRSEPNWLEAETKRLRLDSVGGNTAEEWTKKRRAERAAMKMERARIELQQIEEQKKIEQGVIDGGDLAKPTEENTPNPTADGSDVMNLDSDSTSTLAASEEIQKGALQGDDLSKTLLNSHALDPWVWNAARLPLDFTDIPPGGIVESDANRAVNKIVEQSPWNPARIPLDYGPSFDEPKEAGTEDLLVPVMVDPKEAPTIVDDAPILLEDAPVVQDEKPSYGDEPPEEVASLPEAPMDPSADRVEESPTEVKTDIPALEEPAQAKQETPREVLNQEHLQLSLEEAFFLQYSFGILDITFPNSVTEAPKSNAELLRLFRRHCAFPPAPSCEPLQPDDDFMLHYVVYHHFRSLGWVVRDGVKFAVDYLLYERGPAFKHAEFAIQIIPSYTHTYWFETEDRRSKVMSQKHAWHWFHCVNRVQTQVTKTLVLCYVDIPPPEESDTDSPQSGLDIGKLLKSYKIREFCIRRWSANRNRG